MTTSNIQQSIKKYFYSGVGMAAHTAEIVQQSVNELKKQGKVSESEGKRIVGGAIQQAESRYNTALHSLVKMSTDEIAKLQKRIEQLEKKSPARKKSPVAAIAMVNQAKKKVKAVKKKVVSKAKAAVK